MIHECLVRGLNIRLDTQSEVDAFREETYASKEPETLDWIDQNFSAGEVLYDIGANVGLYSLYTAMRFKGKCCVLSIEPESQNFAKLNQNIFINGLSDSITSCCLAMVDRIGIGTLNIHPYAYETWNIKGRLVSGPAMHAFESQVDHSGKSFKPLHRQGVMSATVDSLWSNFQCPFPNHIKIDVDGPELSVVRGMEKTLKDSRLRTVLVELEGETGASMELRAILISNGLKEKASFAEVSKGMKKAERFAKSYNSVFVREG